MNVRWMAEGKFSGQYSPNPSVQKAAKKFNLDPPSACKLADALETRDDADSDMARISSHLERSNKPSSMVMMLLKTLKAGGKIEDATKPVAIGSWLHKQEAQRDSEKKDKRSRSRKRSKSGGGRYRSRSNRRGRSGSRGRDRSRGRGKSRDRGGRRSRDR